MTNFDDCLTWLMALFLIVAGIAIVVLKLWRQI